MAFVFDPPACVSVPVVGGGEFPVRRIFCVGKNYAAHVAEMGGDARNSSPVFFTKPADAIVQAGAPKSEAEVGTSSVTVSYPRGTTNLHYEAELVIAMGAHARAMSAEEVRQHTALIFGYAAGCDLTRRDAQHRAKEEGGPWDVAKAFDQSAPIGPISPAAAVPAISEGEISLKVNGELRQNARFSAMIWSIAEIIAALSALFDLQPGDLIFTGTPEGVGPLTVGDQTHISITGLAPVAFTIR